VARTSKSSTPPAARAARASSDATTATRSPPPKPNFTAAYSKSGWTATARLAGSVHGVVVQIISDAGAGSPPRSKTAFSAASSAASKRTKMLSSSRSWYSSSASARAVRFSMDQCTGLSWRYTRPCSTRRAKTSSTAASYPGLMVM